MNIINFFELFFVATGGIAMPFIVISVYFSTFPTLKERCKPVAILYLIIAVAYSLIYSYFA